MCLYSHLQFAMLLSEFKHFLLSFPPWLLRVSHFSLHFVHCLSVSLHVPRWLTITSSGKRVTWFTATNTYPFIDYTKRVLIKTSRRLTEMVLRFYSCHFYSQCIFMWSATMLFLFTIIAYEFGLRAPHVRISDGHFRLSESITGCSITSVAKVSPWLWYLQGIRQTSNKTWTVNQIIFLKGQIKTILVGFVL